MNGFEAVGSVSWLDRGLRRVPPIPRWVRETFVILGASGTVLLFSGPVRGELADRIAGWALVGAVTRMHDLLAPAWISPVVWQVVISLLLLVAFALIVLLLAAALQAVSPGGRYVFNAVLERRFAVVPTRFEVISTALPLTLGLALASKGPVALCACVVFAVLLTVIRLTVGHDYEVLVSQLEHNERKPPLPKKQEVGVGPEDVPAD